MTMQVLLKLSFKTVLYSCLVIVLLQAPRALAYDGPKIAFDAIYEVVLPMGSGTLRQASDGHGHMLSWNTAFNGNEDGQILDFNKGSSTLIIPRKKAAILMKMTASSANLIYDNSISKKADAKPLGEKTIGGHPCHGWQISTAGVSTESWIGDDIKYLVQSQTTSGKIKMTMTLKKWSSTGPGESVFQIPADYKLNQFQGNNSGQSLDAGDLAIVSDLLKANKTLEAVDQLSKMLAKNPADKTLLIMRGGILYRSLNRSDEALKDFNKAISVDPDFYQAYKRRGEYYSHLKKFESAMADFNTCIRLAPEYGEGYFARGLLHAKKGENEAAIEDFDKAEKFHVQDLAKLQAVRAACSEMLKQNRAPTKDSPS